MYPEEIERQIDLEARIKGAVTEALNSGRVATRIELGPAVYASLKARFGGRDFTRLTVSSDTPPRAANVSSGEELVPWAPFGLDLEVARVGQPPEHIAVR